MAEGITRLVRYGYQGPAGPPGSGGGGGGGASSGVPTIVWKPGAVSTGAIYATWAEVHAQIIAAIGDIKITIDDGLAPALVPAGVWNCFQRARFASATPARDLVTIIKFAAGAILVNPASFESIQIWHENAGPIIRVTLNGSITFTYNSTISVRTGATGSAIEVTNAVTSFQIAFFALSNAQTQLVSPPASIVDLQNAGAFFLVVMTDSGFASLPTSFVQGGAGTFFVPIVDASAPVPTQINLLGTTAGTRSDLASNTEPSRGITGAEPANPIQGQLYFDTTIGVDKFWNGLAWVIPSVRKVVQLVGDGVALTYNVPHNMNDNNVHVTVYDTIAPMGNVVTVVERPDANSVDVTFLAAPGVNQYSVVVMG